MALAATAFTGARSGPADAMRIWHQSLSDLDLAPFYRVTLRRHADAVMPPGDVAEVHGLRPGTYGRDFAPIHAVRHRHLEFLNESQVCEAALAAERAGYDALRLAGQDAARRPNA